MKKSTPIVIPKEPEQHKGQTIFFDVYPWLVANRRKKGVAMTGPFRLGFALRRLYWPAVLLDQDEAKEWEPELIILSNVLGKNIVVLGPSTVGSVTVWISLSVDYYCPYIPLLRHACKFAILHDVMSAKGVFGEQNSRNFLLGVAAADVLLCVSDLTWTLYREFEKEYIGGVKPMLVFQNCHHFGSNDGNLEKIANKKRDSLLAVSLHSLFRRKNIFRTIELSGYLCTALVHVGELYADDFPKEELELFHEACNRSYLTWYAAADDQQVLDLMCFATYFICSSFEEGFSMPAMEAIICGVPYIYLSDIPIHREVYGRYNVNFFNPTLGSTEFSTKPLRITPEDRSDIFHRHSFESMVAPLQQYLIDHNLAQ